MPNHVWHHLFMRAFQLINNTSCLPYNSGIYLFKSFLSVCSVLDCDPFSFALGWLSSCLFWLSWFWFWFLFWFRFGFWSLFWVSFWFGEYSLFLLWGYHLLYFSNFSMTSNLFDISFMSLSLFPVRFSGWCCMSGFQLIWPLSPYQSCRS